MEMVDIHRRGHTLAPDEFLLDAIKKRFTIQVIRSVDGMRTGSSYLYCTILRHSKQEYNEENHQAY